MKPSFLATSAMPWSNKTAGVDRSESHSSCSHAWNSIEQRHATIISFGFGFDFALPTPAGFAFMDGTPLEPRIPLALLIASLPEREPITQTADARYEALTPRNEKPPAAPNLSGKSCGRPCTEERSRSPVRAFQT